MSRQQPEALRLAEQLRDMCSQFKTPSHERGVVNGAIQELHRQHDRIDTDGLTKYQYNQYLRWRRKLLQHDLMSAVAKHVYLLNPNHILLVNADESCKDIWDACKGVEE